MRVIMVLLSLAVTLLVSSVAIGYALITGDYVVAIGFGAMVIVLLLLIARIYTHE